MPVQVSNFSTHVNYVLRSLLDLFEKNRTFYRNHMKKSQLSLSNAFTVFTYIRGLTHQPIQKVFLCTLPAASRLDLEKSVITQFLPYQGGNGTIFGQRCVFSHDAFSLILLTWQEDACYSNLCR